MADIPCPYCGTVHTETRNHQYKCKNCGATINVNNNGEIKSSKPGK